MTITRKAAKKMIDSGWTAEDVKEVFPSFETENFDVLVAFANGRNISSDYGSMREGYIFNGPRDIYTILPETITLTGPGGTFEFPKPDPKGEWALFSDNEIFCIIGYRGISIDSSRLFYNHSDAEFWRDNFPKLLGM